MNNEGGPKRVYQRAHPLVRFLGAEVKARKLSYPKVSEMSGYEVGDIARWFRGESKMALPAFVDVANGMGYEVRLVPKEPKP